MAKVPFVGDAPQAYDSGVVLAGIVVPGIQEIKWKTIPNRWDRQTSNGIDGEIARYFGFGVAKFDLLVTIWTAEHWRQWAKLAASLRLKPGTKLPGPLQIIHPELAFYGVTQITTDDLVPETRNKIHKVTIPCVQWFPVKRKLVTQTLKARVNTAAGTDGMVASKLASDPRNSLNATPPSAVPRRP